MCNDKFAGDLHFSHGSSNSFGVILGFYGDQVVALKKYCPIKKKHLFMSI